MRPGLALLIATALLLAPIVWAGFSVGELRFEPRGSAAYQSSTECDFGLSWYWGECR